MIKTIPYELTKKGVFCCWRYEDRNGKKTKVPYTPHTGERAKSNDPQSFTGYLTACEASRRYDGVGLGIFDDICAIDLDHCIDGEGNYDETAARIIEMMHSYTELSPSGTGVHILFCAKDFQYDTGRYFIMNHEAGIEVYVAGATSKYVTLTGNRCSNHPFGERSQELRQVLETYMVRPNNAARNAINAVNSVSAPPDVLRRAMNCRSGAAFKALWAGDTTGYSSQSEADYALCSHLAFWTGRDAARMDELFRQSGLMRPKWDRKQSGSTYGQITIRNAIQGCKDAYGEKRQLIVPAAVQQPEPAAIPAFLPVRPLTPQCCELPPFPTEALPEPLRTYVTAVAEHSQTAPDMAAVIGLGTLAVCLQGKYRVQGSPGYYEPLSLYTVVIASPGERKSSVMNDMTRHLQQYADEFNQAQKSAISANRRERDALQRRINYLQRKMEQSSTAAEEAQLNTLMDQLDSTPEMKPTRFFADDCSSEALTSLMAENGGVISVISTEGGIFDMMNGRYSNKVNIDVWLKGHCGDPIHVDRKTREAESIQHPALSAVLSIQPCVLEEIMTNTTMSGRGLIARFLYASPPSRIGSRSFHTASVPPETEAAYRSMIYQLMALERPEEPRTLTLDEEAAQQIAAYFQQHEQFLVGEGQAISDWASKYIGAVLRIAGLIHATETAQADAAPISGDTIQRAIRIGQYFLQHSLYAYSMMGTDLSIQKARFVLAKLRKKGITEIKRAELFQMCRGKFFRKTEELLPTLDLLADHGYIRMEEPVSFAVGRPPDMRIFVNPDAE